ncbi:MAG: hypothetical protein WKF96_16660 [Solirubrobacteraceae bacterium]
MELLTHPEMDVRAFPTVTETAAMLDINKSTVSKQAQDTEQANGTRRVPAAEVLRLALHHRKVPVTQVAQALIDYAGRHAPQERNEVERQVREFYALDRERPKEKVSRDQFLSEARKVLDERSYAELERRYDDAYGRRPKTHLVSEPDGLDA